MSIDNFELIKPLLTFDSEDDFYFAQIIQRKKDNPNGIRGCNNSSRLIKAYYITSTEKLDTLKDEMIFFADHFNARVGINLNKRSFYKTAFNTLQTIANQMHNKDFRNVRSAYNTACGVHNGDSDKRWLLDVDGVGRATNDMILFIERKLEPLTLGEKFLAIIPSKNGCHLITKPFNASQFAEKYPDVEVHKNNPTNLYIP